MLVTRICLALLCLVVLAAPASAADDPVLAALGRAELALQIQPQQESAWRADYRHATLVAGALPKGSIRRRELIAVLNITRGMAARGVLSADLMPMAFLTLQRNADWWATHGPPTSGGGATHGPPPAGGSRGERAAVGRSCKPLRFPKKRRRKARAARLTFPG